MAHYIDKSAVVAEIERLKECNRKICAGDFDFLRKTYPEHYYSTEIYNSILSFLDTLEVIEIGVDLGDPKGDIGVKTVWDSSNLLEISRHGNPHIGESLEEAATKYAQDKYLPVQTAQSFKAGANWQKEKACEWLKENKDHPFINCEDPCLSGYLSDKFIEDFKKAMEE